MSQLTPGHTAAQGRAEIGAAGVRMELGAWEPGDGGTPGP